MRALTLLTNYVRNTLRTLAVALLLPVGIAAPVTIITAPAHAQGVPVVDTQNIAQNIQQLRQMIEDELLQNEQLLQMASTRLGQALRNCFSQQQAPSCRAAEVRRRPAPARP